MRDPVGRTLRVVSALLVGRILTARDIAILCGTKPAAARRLMVKIEHGLPCEAVVAGGARAIRIRRNPLELAAAFGAGAMAGEALPVLGKIARAIFAQPTDLRGAPIMPTPTDPNRPRAKR